MTHDGVHVGVLTLVNDIHLSIIYDFCKPQWSCLLHYHMSFIKCNVLQYKYISNIKIKSCQLIESWKQRVFKHVCDPQKRFLCNFLNKCYQHPLLSQEEELYCKVLGVCIIFTPHCLCIYFSPKLHALTCGLLLTHATVACMIFFLIINYWDKS